MFNKMTEILKTEIETPLGQMYACSTQKGICLLEFIDRRRLETEFKELTRYFDAEIVTGESPYFLELRRELNEYFEGKLQKFTIPIDATGTIFQIKVWEQLLKIPYGQTVSYKTQAEVMGKPEAIRAVANANGHNRISIIIPCHRVIGEDGSLTGYGGGLSRKRWLLEHERKHSNERLNLF
jgi:AraC family transcriptional regulator, regulatory protein of adaptative response / methylated-DNA-[protein]-cysteine methyltransferase